MGRLESAVQVIWPVLIFFYVGGYPRDKYLQRGYLMGRV